MKEALSIQKFKAVCEYFFEAGYKKRSQFHYSPAGIFARGETVAPDFEQCFDQLMQGKYDSAVKDLAFKKQWEEMQARIDKHIEEFDIEQKRRAGEAVLELSKIIIT